jgi:hypothetical protein
MYLEQAKEPDNIIWENLYIRGPHYVARIVAVTLTCIFIILAFFVASVYFNSKATKLETHYPSIDCDLI